MRETQELLDREAIRDCLFRYCRGVDRLDESALRSAYWPDGTDHHGPYQGSAEGFVDFAVKALASVDRGIHQLHNILIEFREAGAAVETYFSEFRRQRSAGGELRQTHMMGRYLDWFEKRGAEWRVKNRTVVFDWIQEIPTPEGSERERFGRAEPIGARFPEDPVYRL